MPYLDQPNIRLRTYENWPQKFNQLSRELSQDGWYLEGKKIRCYYCKSAKKISNIEKSINKIYCKVNHYQSCRQNRLSRAFPDNTFFEDPFVTANHNDIQANANTNIDVIVDVENEFEDIDDVEEKAKSKSNLQKIKRWFKLKTSREGLRRDSANGGVTFNQCQYFLRLMRGWIAGVDQIKTLSKKEALLQLSFLRMKSATQLTRLNHTQRWIQDLKPELKARTFVPCVHSHVLTKDVPV